MVAIAAEMVLPMTGVLIHSPTIQLILPWADWFASLVLLLSNG
jgi:hypothetical protein